MRQPNQEPNIDPELHAAIADHHFHDPRFAIWYSVPHLDEQSQLSSPFMAFSMGAAETAPLLECVLKLPHDVREVIDDRGWTLTARAYGVITSRINPLSMTSFASVAQILLAPFRCVLSNESTCEQVDRLISNAETPWLHLSTVPGDNRLYLESVTDDDYRKYALAVVVALRRQGAHDGFCDAVSGLMEEKLRSRSTRKIACPAFEHLVTMPNETSIKAFRMRPSITAPLRPNNPGRYVDAIVRTAEVVEHERERLLRASRRYTAPTSFSLVLESVSWLAYRGFYDERPDSSKASRRTWRMIAKSFRARDNFVSTADSEWLSEPAFHSFSLMRAREMLALSVSAAMQNSPTMTPVLRLEPRLIKLRGILTQIGSCARGQGPHQVFKLRKMARTLSDLMTSRIDSRYLQFISRYREQIGSVNLISDMPLEWVRVSGMPLTLKHDTSRVPATPGSLTFLLCALSNRSIIPVHLLQEVLVIRSFAEGDHLKFILQSALDRDMTRNGNPVRFRFVDVSTPEEFVEALRNYNGAMMIFDGHGERDRENAVGSIIIGGARMDVWEYGNRLNMPPIVLLSACDTLPIDGSHGATAVGMLALGARTVLGTMFPIDARKSAIFLARLSLRISEYIPIMLDRYRDGVDWRMVMAGMLRMVHVTELTRDLIEEGVLPEEALDQVMLIGNQGINGRNPNWYSAVKQAIVDRSLKSKAETLEAIEHIGALTDALKYVQLGRPDLVRIVRETLNEKIERLGAQHGMDFPTYQLFDRHAMDLSSP